MTSKDSKAAIVANPMLPAVLLRIGLSLSKDGFQWYETKWTGKETANSYIVKTEKDEEEKNRPAKRVKKESLMVPTTIMYETYKHIAYRIWCLPEDAEKAKSKLEVRIVELGKSIRDEALQVFVHLNGR
jgi:hypothetical protein